LLLAKAPYCKAPSGLAPYSWYSCLAHQKPTPFDAGWNLIGGSTVDGLI
jgi:hypothetical protein